MSVLACVIAKAILSVPERDPKRSAVDFEYTIWYSHQDEDLNTCKGSKLDSNLNSTARPTSCKGYIFSKITKYTV